MRPPHLILAMLLAATAAGEGAIYYSGVREINIPTNDNGVSIRMSDGFVTLSPVSNLDGASWINFFFSGTGIASSTLLRPVITAPPSGNGDGLVLKKLALEDIGAADHFASGANGSENHVGAGVHQFQVGVPGYIGFAMRSTAGGPANYGWIRVTFNELSTGTVHDWAYEQSAGVSIQAGAVPEPETWTLATLAAASLLGVRRRK